MKIEDIKLLKSRYKEINEIAIKKTEALKLEEPKLSKFGDIQIGEISVPLYRDPYMAETEFLVCYKQNTLIEPGFITLPYIPVMRPEQEIITEYDEEEMIEIKRHPKAGNITAIICNVDNPEKIKEIEERVNNHING
jgi:superfamily I DNA and/or RNA helicase